MTAIFVGGGFDMVEIAGYSVEMFRKGSGPPMLYLHGGHGFAASSPFIQTMSSHFEVFAPSHPGFGATPQVDHLSTVDDLGFHYLDIIDALGLQEVTVVGASFGGWIALDMAVKNSSRIGNLILLGSTGAKFNDREHAQFADPFLTDDPDLPGRFFFKEDIGEAAFGAFDFKGLGEEAALRFARNAEAFMRFGWSPLLHNPAMRSRLHRIKVPTYVLWGAQDRVAPLDYGRALAAAIPGARFDAVPDAGHYLDIERPDEVSRRVLASLMSDSASGSVA